MSGGSMDYAYAKVSTVAEDVERSIEQGGNHPGLRHLVAEHLHRCADLLRQIEWADSGDTGPDDWKAAAEDLVGVQTESASREAGG